MQAASTRTVPLRAVGLSFLAVAGVCGAMVLWPDALLEEQLLASVLALIPAFLLAYYRGWARVSVLLGIGMITLAILRVLATFVGEPFGTFPLVLLLVAPYVAIALGAGWFGEVRRSAAHLRATQLQLIQSEKLESMGRLAAGVAHEVKNPLMTILTCVKVLARRLPDADPATRQLLKDMIDAVSRADTIIGGLLSYSRQQELSPAPVDVNTTIERSLLLLKHDLDRRHIAIVKELDASLPPLDLDEFKMQQVFIDLITNALHAMGEQGTLTLRTLRAAPGAAGRRAQAGGASAGAVVVEIDDTGPGIPDPLLHKVFDPFFTTKPTGVGTGLGLSVSKQIVEMHGGTIGIANRAAGGARVTLGFGAGRREQAYAEAASAAG